MPQLAEHHERQPYRQHEGDQRGERGRERRRQPSRTRREVRGVQGQRAGGGEQHGPAERDHRDADEDVKPGACEVRGLRQHREREQRRSGNEQDREHQHHQHLRRIQRGGKHDADDHQDRPEHAAHPRQQRAAEHHPNQPSEAVGDGGEAKNGVREHVHQRDQLPDPPRVEHQRSHDGDGADQRGCGVRGAGEPDRPIPQYRDGEHHGEQRDGEVDHVADQPPDVRPRRRVGDRDEVLDHRHGRVAQEPRHERVGERAEEQADDRVDDVPHRRDMDPDMNAENRQAQRRGVQDGRVGGRSDRKTGDQRQQRDVRQPPARSSATRGG